MWLVGGGGGGGGFKKRNRCVDNFQDTWSEKHIYKLVSFFKNKYFEIYDEYKPVLRCVQTKID